MTTAAELRAKALHCRHLAIGFDEQTAEGFATLADELEAEALRMDADRRRAGARPPVP